MFNSGQEWLDKVIMNIKTKFNIGECVWIAGVIITTKKQKKHSPTCLCKGKGVLKYYHEGTHYILSCPVIRYINNIKEKVQFAVDVTGTIYTKDRPLSYSQTMHEKYLCPTWVEEKFIYTSLSEAMNAKDRVEVTLF